MEPFKFKLEGLLKLREFQETLVKIELGEIVKEINRLKDEIEKLNSEISLGYHSQEKVLEEGAEGKMLQFYPYYIQGKKEHIKVRENQLFALDKQFKEKVRELEEAMGDTKIVENLKEKKFSDYKNEKKKKEFEALDELAIVKGNKIRE